MLSAVPFVLSAVIFNVYPYGSDSATEVLVGLHLPIVLWFAVAYPYMRGTIRSSGYLISARSSRRTPKATGATNQIVRVRAK